MKYREAFTAFIKAENTAGSNRAASYIRAIDLLDSILGRKAPKELNAESIWSIASVKQIQSLYELVLEHRKLGEAGIFGGEKPVSYWRDGFCSAALKSYREFLVVQLYEQRMWKTYQDVGIAPEQLSSKLASIDVDSVELLLDGREGKDAVREVKTRIGQRFFRKMILRQYGTQCCITGLNVPEVLRASHIVGWADDPANRLNPANGLCLSATYDAAFEKHLISFDENFRLIFSPALREYCSNEAFKTQFAVFEGQPMRRPERFFPERMFMEKHRDKLVA